MVFGPFCSSEPCFFSHVGWHRFEVRICRNFGVILTPSFCWTDFFTVRGFGLFPVYWCRSQVDNSRNFWRWTRKHSKQHYDVGSHAEWHQQKIHVWRQRFVFGFSAFHSVLFNCSFSEFIGCRASCLVLNDFRRDWCAAAGVHVLDARCPMCGPFTRYIVSTLTTFFRAHVVFVVRVCARVDEAVRR